MMSPVRVYTGRSIDLATTSYLPVPTLGHRTFSIPRNIESAPVVGQVVSVLRYRAMTQISLWMRSQKSQASET